ncbi:Gfo/Idh/MocA family protein [Caldanaerobius polysaccharolyticus]|uniref:Gfo/Idh/MocA family protein n=1 Tax=Caldanaerobius polysaccharolyticus TaxID=44256 RepID=UPI000479EF46|nr:Gfo/Idh/MocA family oxidoreductase [Caldanaerobius polysaccharolyticus]
MKICIIGTSGHYVYALRGIKADKSSEVVGISPGCEGENIEKLISQVCELGFKPKVYDNFREMLAELKPDIAVINTFFYKNSQIAIDAMYRGINVYIEKPVATTLQDLNKLIDAYQKTKVKLSTMFGIRYTSHFWTAYNLVKGNQIGEVRLIHAQKSYKLGIRQDFYKRRETYGGTIPWVGSHAVDWIYWFSGKKFKSVFATHSKMYNNRHGDLEVSATCSFTLEDEAFATVNIDYLRPQNAPTHDDDRIRIVGTKGIVEVVHGKVFMLNESVNGLIEVPLQEGPVTFYDFIKEVRGEGNCLVSADDAFYVTKACLLARQAADENRIIEFE